VWTLFSTLSRPIARRKSKTDWIQQSFKEGTEIVLFITSHHNLPVLFRQHCNLQLLKLSDTCFCTKFLSHMRLLQVKDSLQEMVVDKCYKTWVQNKNYGDTSLEIAIHVLDENRWKTAGIIQKGSEPIVPLLCNMDAGGACPAIGKVCFKMFEIAQQVSCIQDLSEQNH
jgi:hypothetical protein